MKRPYYLLFKTGDAELRALAHCDFIDDISPIIELTKSRRTIKDHEGDIEKRIASVANIFHKRPVILDITTDEKQSNEQTHSLYSPENGYQNWTQYIKNILSKKLFKDVAPCLLVNATDQNFNENLAKQVHALSDFCPAITYRSPITDDFYKEDLIIVNNSVPQKYQVNIIIDCMCIKGMSQTELRTKIETRINKIKSICTNMILKIIILATSFPNSPSEYVENSATNGEFDVDEISLFNALNSTSNIYYGDYGSINPQRNDEIIMARGWIPRIDVTIKKGNGLAIYFERLRRKQKDNQGQAFTMDYAYVYTSVARKIMQNPNYPSELKNNWGLEQIQYCAEGKAPGASPSFWISVRMSIFIHQQINRLKDLK